MPLLGLDCFPAMPFQTCPLGKNLPKNYFFGEAFLGSPSSSDSWTYPFPLSHPPWISIMVPVTMCVITFSCKEFPCLLV